MRWYGPCEHVTYRTQRDNPFDAARQCWATALVMALDGAGVKLPTTGPQPEGELCQFAVDDPRVMEHMRTHQMWAVRLGWPPYTEGYTLAVAANLWLGRPGLVHHTRDRKMEAVVADLAAGRCSAVMGRFTPGGHAVAIIGVQSDQYLEGAPEPEDIHLDAVTHYMLHDPWGDWHQGYKDHNGARCIYSPSEIMQLVLHEGTNAKWVHYIAAKEA